MQIVLKCLLNPSTVLGNEELEPLNESNDCISFLMKGSHQIRLGCYHYQQAEWKEKGFSKEWGREIAHRQLAHQGIIFLILKKIIHPHVFRRPFVKWRLNVFFIFTSRNLNIKYFPRQLSNPSKNRREERVLVKTSESSGRIQVNNLRITANETSSI